MDNDNLVKLIRARFDISQDIEIVVMDIKTGSDCTSSFYLVTCLLVTDYKQEVIPRKLFKIRFGGV